MSVMRVFWLILALVGAGYAASSAWAPVSEVSLSCAKTGVYDDETVVRCGDPIAQVFGVWRLTMLGVLLAGPPAIAAISARRSVSWTVIAMMTVVGLTGVVMWTSFWKLLIIALPLAVLALAAVLVDIGVRASKRRAGRSSELSDDIRS